MSFERDDKLDLSGRPSGAAWRARLAGGAAVATPDSGHRRLCAEAFNRGRRSPSGERLAPLAEVLWHGLRRAHPRLTRDEFLDLPITIAELVAALPVVIEQAGGRRVDGTDTVPGAGSASPGKYWRRAFRCHRLACARRRPRNRTALDPRSGSRPVDIPFLEDLHRAWADFPPLRRMVAACARPQAAGAGVARLPRADRDVSWRPDRMNRRLP